MAEDDIHQPNDKFVKATFSVPDNARAFFQSHLPAHLAPFFDWESLRHIPSAFIAPQFAASESDLLFSVGIRNRKAYVYLLFEHQSTEDPRMALRLLGYIVQIWQRFVRENPQSTKLPAVFPLVLAQGKRPWKTSTKLEDLIDLPSDIAEHFRPWQPALLFHLMELARHEKLHGNPSGILALRALKAEPFDELLSEVVWDEPLLQRISEDALEHFLRYIVDADVDESLFLQRIHSLQSPPLTPHTMTLAERLIQRGKNEGISEGMSQGMSQGMSEGLSKGRFEGQLHAMRSAILRALELKHGQVTRGVAEAVASITDEPTLQNLHDRAILSSSIEEFAQHL